MSRRLTPRMEEALRLLVRGPLEKTPDGWVSTVGCEHKPLNSHTIRCLKSEGFVRIIGGNMAHIRELGRCALRIEEYAA